MQLFLFALHKVVNSPQAGKPLGCFLLHEHLHFKAREKPDAVNREVLYAAVQQLVAEWAPFYLHTKLEGHAKEGSPAR